jgi:CRISPR-associated protein Cas2
MALLQNKTHLIAYDIGDPKRLGRIHRFLRKQAMPIQYSVFLIECNAVQLRALRDELEAMIDPKKDDIRIYTLPEKAEIMTLGQQHLAEGIYLLGGGNEYLAKL